MKKELLKKIKEFCNEYREKDTEVITFSPIQKTIKTSERKGKYVIFKKITNRYLNGGKYLKKFYKEI